MTHLNNIASEKPLVSVIINCFNGEKYLREALDSVITQTYKNWEIIFWDNQSTDKSAEIFKSYKDSRLKYYCASSHANILYEARNYALQKANGDFIAFLDVDDWWLPNKLEKQIPLFDDPDVGLVYGNLWRLFEKKNKKKFMSKGDLIDENFLKRIHKANIETVKVRSPLFCETIDGICQKCYGRDLARGILVNMGEAVGIQAAQSIGEPGTQLTMRTFHIGGAVTQTTVQSNIISNYDAKIKIQNNFTVINSEGQLIVMSRNCKVIFLDVKTKKEKSSNHIPYGAKLLIKDGKKVKPEDLVASWDPYTIPIISEKNGIVEYEDVIDGFSSREIVDPLTGITHRSIIDWKLNPKSKDLKPQIKLVDQKGNVVKTTKNKEVKYFLPIDAVLNVSKGIKISAGTVIARIPKETSLSKDITGGLPRVADLFEARKPKDHGILNAIDGVVKWGKDYKAKRAIVVEPVDKKQEEKNKLKNYENILIDIKISKNKHLNSHSGRISTHSRMITFMDLQSKY